MARVLLLKAVERTRDLEGLLSSSGMDVMVASSVRQARKLLLDAEFSLVIIDTPLFDGSGRDVAIMASGNPGLDVVLLSPAREVESLSYALERYGIFVMSRVASSSEFSMLLRMIKTSRAKCALLEARNEKLLRRIADERLMCEVKCILASKKGMTEEEAHHFIEHRAMDERISLSAAAAVIRRELTAR